MRTPEPEVFLPQAGWFFVWYNYAMNFESQGGEKMANPNDLAEFIKSAQEMLGRVGPRGGNDSEFGDIRNLVAEAETMSVTVERLLKMHERLVSINNKSSDYH